MLFRRTFAASCFALLLLTATNTVWAELNWLDSAQEAARQAEQSGKPILVYVRSASCYYCDLMQKNIWQDAEISKRVSADFVPLKLTQEQNAEAIRALEIKGFPATLVFAADKRFLMRIDGYVEPAKFVAKMEKVAIQQSMMAESIRR